jgi:hypothetical protein
MADRTRSAESDVTATVPPIEDRSGVDSSTRSLLGGRFRIVRKLGAGASGTVFEAIDHSAGGRRLALKILHGASAGSRLRAKNEFRSLLDVAHPNLVGHHELFATGDPWFLTMELVRGQDFVSYVREPSAGATFDEGRLRSALGQLARGLVHLHASGQVHCDLKPANVLVTAAGRVVIVDFGLVRSLSAAGSERAERGLVGTPAYAAPEQVDARRMEPALDWYAAGAMLYEALTGRAPFAGSGAREVMAHKRDREPPAPSTVAAVPVDLEQLCARLLRRDPATRADGRDVFEALGLTEDPEPDEVALASTGRDHERELAALGTALDRARAGQQALVLVRGEPGSGKTSLLRAFARTARARGACVVEGRCYVHENVPFNALDGVVDALTQHLRAASPGWLAGVLADEDVRLLARCFPVMARVPGFDPRAGDLADPVAEAALRRRAFRALKALLGRTAQDRPLILLVDDLHLADVDSAALLRELLSPPAAPPMLFVGTVAPRLASGAPGMRELFREGGPPVGVTRIELAALPDDAGQTRERLRASVARRLERLPEAEMRLLEGICAAGRRLPRSLLLRAFQGASMETLREMRVARWTRETPGDGAVQVQPHDDLVREAVLARLPEARRREILGTLADRALELPEPPLDLVVHAYAEAGRDADAAALAERAAAQAGRQLAFQRSADLLDLAARAARTPAAAVRLRAALAEAYVRAGRSLKAARAYEAAAGMRGAAPGEDALELRERAMTQYFVSGHVSKGRELLRDVARERGVSLGPTPAALAHGLRMAAGGPPPRLQGERAPRASDRADRTRLALLWSAALPLMHTAPGASGLYSLEALVVAARVGDGIVYRQAASVLHAYTPTALRGRPARTGGGEGAEDGESGEAARTADLTAAGASYWDLAFVKAVRGVSRLFTADFLGALRDAWEPATSTAAQTGIGLSVQSLARLTIMPTLYWLGRIGQLAEVADEFIQEARDAGNRHLEVHCRVVAAHRWLRTGDAARTREELARARAAGVDYDHQALHDPWWEVGLQLYEGNAAGALAVYSRVARTHFARTAIWAANRAQWAMTAGTCWAALADRGVRRGEAAREMARAAASARRNGSRVARPYAEHLEGARALLAGDRRAAVAALLRAIDAYDALGMRLHAASVRFGLAARGEGSPDLERAARETFTAEGIGRPELWAYMLAAGVVPYAGDG